MALSHTAVDVLYCVAALRAAGRSTTTRHILGRVAKLQGLSEDADLDELKMAVTKALRELRKAGKIRQPIDEWVVTREKPASAPACA